MVICMIIFANIFLILSILLFPSFSCCAEYKNDLLSHVGTMGSLYLDAYKNEPFLVVIEDDSTFLIKSITSSLERKISTPDFTVEDVNLSFNSNEVLVFWKSKENATGYKYLWIEILDRKDLKTIRKNTLNNAHDVLTPIDFFKFDDTFIVSWDDERDGKIPTAYFNYSKDNGINFQQNDICPFKQSRLSLPYFQKFKGQYFLFSTACIDGKCGVYYQNFNDFNNITKPVLIAETKDWGPSVLKALVTDKGFVVLWGGAKGIHSAFYDESTKSFITIALPETENMGVNRMSVKNDKLSTIYLVASYKNIEDSASKDKMFFFKSDDGGKNWSKPISIRNHPFNNTSAVGPDIAITESGVIAVTWQDHRYIRANIFVNYSKDGGKTWLPEDIILSRPAGSTNDLYPTIIAVKDNLYVHYSQALSDMPGNKTKNIVKEVRIK